MKCRICKHRTRTELKECTSGKLPPIESDLQSVAEMGQEHTTETKVITKKKVMLKKIKKKSDVNTEEQEDLGISCTTSRHVLHVSPCVSNHLNLTLSLLLIRSKEHFPDSSHGSRCS